MRVSGCPVTGMSIAGVSLGVRVRKGGKTTAITSSIAVQGTALVRFDVFFIAVSVGWAAGCSARCGEARS